MDGKEAFVYWSDVRTFFDTYASSRVVEVGKNKTADEMFERIYKLEIDKRAAQLATDDYIKKYHNPPRLETIKDWYDEQLDEHHLILKADDMAFYSFCFWLGESTKCSIRVFYRDREDMWSDNE